MAKFPPRQAMPSSNADIFYSVTSVEHISKKGERKGKGHAQKGEKRKKTQVVHIPEPDLCSFLLVPLLLCRSPRRCGSERGGGMGGGEGEVPSGKGGRVGWGCAYLPIFNSVNSSIVSRVRNDGKKGRKKGSAEKKEGREEEEKE